MFCLACGPFGFYAAAQAASHHGEAGFRNTYPHAPKESFWRWKWEQLRTSVPELPRIDVVLISHNHYDHLDLDSVKRLAAMPGGRR